MPEELTLDLNVDEAKILGIRGGAEVRVETACLKRRRWKPWRPRWTHAGATASATTTGRRAKAATRRATALKAGIRRADKPAGDEGILLGEHIMIGALRKLRRDAEASVAGIEIASACHPFVILHERAVILAAG